MHSPLGLSLLGLLLLVGGAQAQSGGADRCETEYQMTKPAGLSAACYPGGSFSSEALDWTCSAECASLFVPFWEVCGERILEIGMIGQDFAPFYNLCRKNPHLDGLPSTLHVRSTAPCTAHAVLPFRDGPTAWLREPPGCLQAPAKSAGQPPRRPAGCALRPTTARGRERRA